MLRIEQTTTITAGTRKYLGNICITPNGSRVTRDALGYVKVNAKNVITNRYLNYVGNEAGCEIWKHEKKNKNGEYKIVTIKKKFVA